MNPRFAQQGVAVLMVLLIMAIATVLAVWMVMQQSLWLSQTQGQFDHAQARHVALAGVDWARAVLADDLASGGIDHGQELWAAHLPPIPLEGGEVQGIIEDRQGLFNLNNLVRGGNASAADVAQFTRLLHLLGLPEKLAATLVDWMDGDDRMSLSGESENAYYLSQLQPCRAANRPLQDMGELERVSGYDQRSIERLRPFVTVLPGGTALNVNFASAEVLSAVLDLPLPEARRLVQQRKDRPFKDVAEFSRYLSRPNVLAVDGVIGVSSQYFKVTGNANIGKAQVHVESLLRREAGSWPVVIGQTER